MSNEFVTLLLELDPVQIIGLAKIVGVEVNETTIGESLLIEICAAYDNMPRRRRRTLLKMLRGEIEVKEKKKNADSANS